MAGVPVGPDDEKSAAWPQVMPRFFMVDAAVAGGGAINQKDPREAHGGLSVMWCHQRDSNPSWRLERPLS